MKKIFTLIGVTVALCWPHDATAAPLTPKTLGELLGIRETPAQTFASGAPAATTGTRHQGQLALKSEALAPQIYASIVYPNNILGMWAYELNEWKPTQLSIDRGILATGGGFEAKGYYYFTRYQEAMGFEEIKTVSYDTSTWQAYDEFTGQIDYVATTIAYSEARDEAYGCFINADRNGYNFVKWDYSYFRPSKVIAPIERPWSGCAFSSDNTLYAIERNGDLYKVDLFTGEQTLVGSTGIEATYLGDATIDPATDIMYWSVCNDTDYGLYKVDLATATATKAYDLLNEEQLCGMYIPHAPKNVPAEAPAKLSSITPSFSGASLTGTIRFYAPSSTKGGTALPTEESLTYTIRANGKVIATGECLPRKTVQAPVTVDATDSYYFTVTTSNEAGESEETGAHKFVGTDTPRMSGNLAATITGSQVKLQWSSVSSTGANGGNIDYSSATYTVTRHPDMKIIADATTDRTVNDELPSPEVRTDYHYTVTATVNGLTSAPLKSPVITLGPITPPAECTFTASTSTAGWTIIDANDDATPWKFSSYDKALQLYGSKGFDDWAITPAVNARKGTSYPVTITVKTSSYYEESFEVMWGTEPTVEAMTNTVIAPTSVKSTTPVQYSGEIAAKESGKIYIGIHGTTQGKSNTLNVASLSIGEGLTAAAPAAPANFKVTSPVDGTRQATVTFNAPSTTMAGDPLAGDAACTKIEILRDGTVIATITTGIGANEETSFTDQADDLTTGTHLYAAVAHNSYGESPAAEAEVLIGARKPVAPENALMIEDGNTGKVTISWDAVTTDVEGNTFSPDAVTYRVIDRQYNTVADKLTETSVTLQAVPEGEQAFCQFAVYAVTAGGESDKMAATAYKPVGMAYTTPWAESFKNGSVSSIFGYNYIKGQEPWQFIPTHDWGVTPQDEDGGFAFLECYGDLTALVTGKINLEGLNNPAFSYYTYNYTSGTVYSNSFALEVDNGDGCGFVTVQEDIVAETGPANQWNKVLVPLNDYEGQSVIFRIVPKNPGLAGYFLDNLRVASNVENNLTATRLTAPNVTDNGKPFEISLIVTNTGENAIQSYTAELWRDDEPADYIDCGRIEPNESKTVVFEQTLEAIHGEDVKYHAVIMCDIDMIEADNTSETVTVGNIAPAVPTVTDLTAASAGSSAELTWSAPNISTAAPEPYTETFDAAESWGNSVDGWKFLDIDKTPVGGINTPNFPCTGLQSWFVVDNTWAGFSDGIDRWAARSGTKFIAAEYVQRGSTPVQSDDWAITPMICGTYPQALSFYAKSFDPKYLETIEVLASSSTSNIDDFTPVGTLVDLPTTWKQYRFKLPAGTKYAAIRSRSIDKYFAFIDDVTFIPADGEPAQLRAAGYNIYRNGTKINSQPVTETNYTDATTVPGRDYTYVVTTVYDKGESAPSNAVRLQVSGIDGINSTDGISIKAVKGMVVVTGLNEGTVTVNGIDGRTAGMADAAPVVRIHLQPGVYVVTAGSRISKVVVR